MQLLLLKAQEMTQEQEIETPIEYWQRVWVDPVLHGFRLQHSHCGCAYPILRAVRESTDARSSHTRGTALLGSGSSSSIWRCLVCSCSSSCRRRPSYDACHAVKVLPQIDWVSIVLSPSSRGESMRAFVFSLENIPCLRASVNSAALLGLWDTRSSHSGSLPWPILLKRESTAIL